MTHDDRHFNVQCLEQTNRICGKHLRSIGTGGLITLTDTAIVEGDHLEIFRQNRDHLMPLPKGIPKTRNQNQWLPLAMNFVVQFYPIGCCLWHNILYSPRAEREKASAVERHYQKRFDFATLRAGPWHWSPL